MVANPGGEDTPVGVWLDAEEGEFAGLSKTGRPQVKQAKVITGAIRVTKFLDDYDVQQILGGNAPERQGGDMTLEEMGLSQI